MTFWANIKQHMASYFLVDTVGCCQVGSKRRCLKHKSRIFGRQRHAVPLVILSTIRAYPRTAWHIHRCVMRDTMRDFSIDWQIRHFPGTVVLLLLYWVECLLVCNSLVNSSRQGRMWGREGLGSQESRKHGTEESCKLPLLLSRTPIRIFFLSFFGYLNTGREIWKYRKSKSFNHFYAFMLHASSSETSDLLFEKVKRKS